MIKNYLELNRSEIEKLAEFINKKRDDKLSFDEIDKQLRTEEYDYGKGVLLAVEEESIIAKILVVLKECSIKGVAYIFRLEIDTELDNMKTVVCELLDQAKSLAQRYGAQRIYFGTGDETIISILNSLNLFKQYSAIRMILKDREIKGTTLELAPLTEGNRKDYAAIHNDAFRDTPNGSTLTEAEVDEYLRNAGKDNYYFIVIADNANIGMLQFNIEDNVGEFDLGLIKSARGKGYGKQLLETAISFLNSMGTPEINLTVITKNTIPYEMYKKRGFQQKRLISDWFQLL